MSRPPTSASDVAPRPPTKGQDPHILFLAENSMLVKMKNQFYGQLVSILMSSGRQIQDMKRRFRED
ncbi:hypothetical protein SK128_016791 [Halocaridina rubra]|uniref:Uncharacterized protein n=1 Tax=Halocaridina rubra TaxID=373956 RepID=A0AAN8XH71_HALRR